jgi:tetratricopeptide (TPR) repeat protein
MMHVSMVKAGLLIALLIPGSLALAEQVTPSKTPTLSKRKTIESPPEELKADVLMARGQYAEAIGAYVALNSSSAMVWNKIGMAYHHLFALEEAEKAYSKSLQLNPRYAPAANNLAAVYYAQHDIAKAEHYYKKALKYAAEDPVIYCNLGTAYFAERKYSKGKKEYRKAFALDANVFTPSQAAMVEAASSREQRIELNYYLAQTYAEAGQQEQAITFLRKAMDEGFKDRKKLNEDKEFAVLRGTPQFKELLTAENLN